MHLSSRLAQLDDTDAHPHHGIVTREGTAIIGETSIELRFTMFLAVVTDANGNERFKVDLGRGAHQQW